MNQSLIRIGDKVNVKALANDLFSDFTGNVVDTRGGLITVRDQDDHHWDCLASQLSPDTDEITS